MCFSFCRFGVIRWIGILPGDKKEGRKAAGVEMVSLHLTDAQLLLFYK